MQIFDLDIIGTHLCIHIDMTSSCDEVFSTIREKLVFFEEKYSRFLEGNWLHNLNKNRRAILDEEGVGMLSYMLDIAHKTDGYFDPTVGKRLTELGYGRELKIKKGADSVVVKNDVRPKGAIPPNASIRRSLYDTGEGGAIQIPNKGNYQDIEISGDEIILHGDILLEFGGVGKGYLIDVIARMLESPGLSGHPIIWPSDYRYLINFGGDLYGKGGWKVGLESPFFSDEVIGTIILDDHYLACSAGTRRAWGEHHHLIDPHTGESAREVVASYIEGGSGMIADSYATALCVMPWELAIATLEKTAEISGVIVRHDGTLYRKEGSRAEVFG